MFIRAYLRASTDEQDAARAKQTLCDFAEEHNHRIANFYQENITGTKIDRPELNRLIDDAYEGDILLIEKVDRLTRLPYEQWKTLKSRIQAKGIQIVSVDQPLTYGTLLPNQASNPIQQALTDFMLDMGAALSRDWYETHRKRTQQGLEKAKAEGKMLGRPANTELHEKVVELKTEGLSYTKIERTLNVSRPTIAKILKDAGLAEAKPRKEDQ